LYESIFPLPHTTLIFPASGFPTTNPNGASIFDVGAFVVCGAFVVVSGAFVVCGAFVVVSGAFVVGATEPVTFTLAVAAADSLLPLTVVTFTVWVPAAYPL